MKVHRLIAKNNTILKGLRSIFHITISLTANGLTLIFFEHNKHSINKWVIMSILFFRLSYFSFSFTFS